MGLMDMAKSTPAGMFMRLLPNAKSLPFGMGNPPQHQGGGHHMLNPMQFGGGGGAAAGGGEAAAGAGIGAEVAELAPLALL